MGSRNDSTRFRSTAEYYAQYRLTYGESAIGYLKDRYDLDDSSRVLDLGCGTGQITIPIAEYAGEVVGMDPNQEMLTKAEEAARTTGVESVEFVRGSDSNLSDDLGSFTLVTMGRAFHWMDQHRTLRRLRSMVDVGGGVAILDDSNWFTSGNKEWQKAVYDLANDYLSDLPDWIGSEDVEYEDPWDEMIAEYFDDVESITYEREHEWNLDSIVGYVFSLSYCSPETFGDDRQAFETELREFLAGYDGEFTQDRNVEIISGKKVVGDE